MWKDAEQSRWETGLACKQAMRSRAQTRASLRRAGRAHVLAFEPAPWESCSGEQRGGQLSGTADRGSKGSVRSS